jgi:hypothetical protein
VIGLVRLRVALTYKSPEAYNASTTALFNTIASVKMKDAE